MNMLTIEEINIAADEHVLKTCNNGDKQVVKDYAKIDFVAGAKYASDKCLEEYNDLLNTLTNLISLEELEERANKLNVKLKLFI